MADTIPKWFIVIPAWGDRHVSHFTSPVLPAIFAALTRAGRVFDAQFLVHTDHPAVIKADFKSRGIKHYTIRPMPVRHSKYWAMSDAHREALRDARVGQYIAFINADMVPSVECFAAAERAFERDKFGMILMAAIRTSDGVPPIGETSRALLDWAWLHRHHWIEDCTWGRGATTCPSLLFFDDGPNAVMRGFHLHPFAIVKPPHALKFEGLTVDEGLAELLPKRCIHVVTDPDEMSFAEMSPPGLMFKSGKVPLSTRDVVRWMTGSNGYGKLRASEMHRWMFGHRIVIRGAPLPDALDVTVCDEILNDSAKTPR